jgi:hypothetical protein
MLNQITNLFTLDSLRLIVGAAFALFAAFIVGYVFGHIISKVIEKVLKIGELQKTLVKYGAVTTHLWDSITNLLSLYIKWLIVVIALDKALIAVVAYFTNMPTYTSFLTPFTDFLVSLLFLIVLVIIGLLLGGFLYKITKDSLVAVGLEAELEKHHVADSLGGIPLSSILASIVKWYVVLVLLTTGTQQFLSTVVIGTEELALKTTMEGLMAYIPQAILGVLILIATLIIADFASTNIKKKKLAFSDLLGVGVEIIILFFGVILALPKLLGVQDPEGKVFIQSLSVMTDSFKFLIIGVSIGLAIAIGLGLKDAIAKATKYYEEEKIEHKKK